MVCTMLACVIMRTRIDDNGFGWLEIGLDIATLAHRALGKILDGDEITSEVQVKDGSSTR